MRLVASSDQTPDAHTEGRSPRRPRHEPRTAGSGAQLRRLLRLAPIVLFLLASLGGSACSEERPPINQVQPNAIAKAFFVGDLDDYDDDPEFYMRNTVVDVAAGAGADGLFTSSDAQPTTRVRFEITEKLLIARLTYELVDHTDGKGRRRTPDGQLVAAFTIDKHFDIRRDYNPTTGEESNVVIENDTDRAWYQREFMRVDWSQNLVTDAYDLDTLSQLGIYYGVKWDPVAYTVDDPQNEDAPVFDEERGYFDVTHKALAAPEVIEDPEWGDFPACWLIGYFPTVSCNPSEITLRQSFLKVTDTDYEPTPIDGTMMDQFGYFTWDRQGWDRRYGVVDDLWRRYATKWNLYERSHAEPTVPCNTLETTPIGQDPHRDADADGTEDECASVGRGSRCDDVVGECTIPLRDRAVRTIVWHVNQESPPDLFEGTARALESWNQAMRVAVQAGRYAECKRTDKAGCEAQIGFPNPFYGDYQVAKGEGPAAVPDIFVLCHNPVDYAAGDVEACGEDGTKVRLGDLRYNMINIIDDVEGMSPWGIMMDAEDPLTGEKISGSVNEWAYVLDRSSSNLVDILALLNGEIPPDDFLTGQNVSSWVERNRVGGSVERGGAPSTEELERRLSSYDPATMAPYFDGIGKVRENVPPAGRHSQRARMLGDAGRMGPGNAALSERLKRLRGTSVEETLASPEMRQAAGFDPTSVSTPEQVRRASPFGRMNPTLRRDEDRKRRMGHAERHSCRMEGPDGDYLVGLARTAQRLFPAPDPADPAAVLAHRETVYNWARRETSAGVMAHELGHSMGLRHNFAASFDSLNYGLPYWQLRTKNGTVTADCEDGDDGESCIGPRYRDPLTQTEIDGNITKYATTSVMDYPGDQNQDMNLVGTYDRAAVRFGYGGTVDVWADPSITVAAGPDPSSQKGYFATAFTVSPGLFGVNYFPPVDPLEPYVYMHYSTYQREFGVLGSCAASGDPDAVLGQKCTGAPLDVVDYRDMQDFVADEDYAAFSWGRNAKAKDPQGRVRHGYMFSSDEYADSGNVPSFSDDAGADAYEQIRFLESSYENRYIFDSFRRNRVQFNSWDVTARVQSRYLDAIQMIAKAFFFGAVLDGDPALPTEDFLADGNFGPLQVGSTYALDMFARILTRPDPGYYCEAEFCGGVQPVGASEQVYSADPAPLPQYGTDYYWFQVGLGDGRYLHNDFDYGQGYFWGDYQTQTGSYYDKVWAVYYLAEAFDFFISNSREDFVDSRYKNVNFATVYPKQIDRLFGSLLTGSDYETFAPWANPKIDDDVVHLADLVYPSWSSVDDLGERTEDSFLIDPGYGWNTQVYAMVWGSMFFPTNWSNQWVDQARIAVLASDEPQWPESETVRFTDPESGMTYRAHSKGTDELFGYTRRSGIAARALERANTLAAWSYLVEVDDEGVPLFEEDGQPVYILDDDGKPQLDPDFAYANAELRRYIDTLDLFRQLVATFEQPISDLPEP